MVYTVPCRPAAKYVDTAGGDRFDLDNSGLVPKYTHKKVWECVVYYSSTLSPSPTQEYGKVPGYLERRREETEAAQVEYDHYVEQSVRRGQMDQVSRQER